MGRNHQEKVGLFLHRECVPTHLLTAEQLNRRFDMKKWTVNDIPTQTGKLAIVTGATGGLGYETALGLARAGAEVVLAGRNREKGRVAVDKIMRALPAAKARFQMLDLASRASVRAFAAEMVAKGRPLDMLINNAGVMDLPTRRLTTEGFQMQFGANQLSHIDRMGVCVALLAATWAGAERMGYYGPNGFYELKGAVASAYVAPKAKDEGLARKLWEVSEKLTGVQWPVEEKSRAAFLGR